MIKRTFWLGGGIALLAIACQPEPERVFTLLDPTETGVTFENRLAESDTFNILNYLYYYNGGGVAIGDLNNDLLPDLYFTANEGNNELYLNRGEFRFENITDHARVAGLSGWTTGVTMADVNGDGWLDLYVSQLGNHEGMSGRNQLYINDADTSQGYPTFTEQAAAYGLDQQTFATQAAFFDYDNDGDLDVYLLNHTVHSSNTYVPVTQGRRDSPQGDQLLRNDDNHFVDVSQEANIYRSAVGYGLSVSVADLNQDGWLDIYVGNDFHENDYLYYNNGDGTFSENIDNAMGHSSRFTMGSDIADINNDARLDLVSLDMKPEDERILKMSAGEDPYDIYQFKLSYGYHHQYARNALQLSVGDRLYSEIGQLAGIATTDWSWAPLFADLDNDGWKDVYITNGILRRPNNLDYIRYISNREIQAALAQGTAENAGLIRKMPSDPIANYAYHNERDLTFSNQATAWGLDQVGFSNGAAYGDLDNDGDLDLVVNNVNEPAFVYRNNTHSNAKHRFLRIRFEGEGKNTYGIGAKVWLYTQDSLQYQELMPTRGFQSSVEPVMHFGVGGSKRVDSLVVVWPDRRMQVIYAVSTNQTLTLRQEETEQYHTYSLPTKKQLPFRKISHQDTILFHHRENKYVDFNREPFLPHLLSQEGPALAVSDVTSDGLDDLFIGGASGQAGALLVQQPNGQFVKSSKEQWQLDKAYEDVTATWLDAENDGDLDLYVGSAGNQFSDSLLADRLYLNNGQGYLTKAKNALPLQFVNTACVVPSDVDHDGDEDIFVGARAVTGQYGLSPQSYLLKNDGRGHFTTIQLPIDGMVTDAIWSDHDQDGWDDLVVVGEWMPITVLKNNKGSLLPKAIPTLDKTDGWWSAIEAADLDSDGDADWVVGNLGYNSVLQATTEEPVSLYINDFDHNGTLEPLITYYRQGKEHSVATMDELTKRIPGLRKKFTDYDTYADIPFREWFPATAWEKAVVRKAYILASGWFESQGEEGFRFHPLPTEVQFAPVRAILVRDVDEDGFQDVLVAGNRYAVDPKQGRYDASFGWWLKGKGNATFATHGLGIGGQISDLAWLQGKDGYRLVVARNDSTLALMKVQPNLSEHNKTVSEEK